MDIQYSIFAPARTPQVIVGKLHGEIVKAVQSTEIREHLANTGIDPLTSTPNELSAYLAAQMKKMREAVVTSGGRADR